MERAISYLTVMPDTQTGIQEFIEQVLREVEYHQSLQLLVKLSAMEKIIKGVKDGIKTSLMQEADMEAEKTFSYNGVKFTKSQKSTYSYDHCDKWNKLHTELESLQKMMQVAQSSFADPETGELIEPAKKTISEYIKVDLPK